MSSSKEFQTNVRQKYGNLKTVKSFIDLTIKAYDDNLDGLMKFISVNDEELEKNILSEMNESTVSEFVDKYGINPEILCRLLTELSESIVDPLLEGYYDKTLDFGKVTNSKLRQKEQKRRQRQKEKKARSKSKGTKAQSFKKKDKKRKLQKDHSRAQTNAVSSARKTVPSSPVSPIATKNTFTPKLKVNAKRMSARDRSHTASDMNSSSGAKKKKKKVKTPRTPKTPTTPNTSRRTSKKNKNGAKSPKNGAVLNRYDTPAKASKHPGPLKKKRNSKIEDALISGTLPLNEDSEIADEKEKEKENNVFNIKNDMKSFEDYLSHFYVKFVDSDLTLPVSWTCLFYHLMGTDFEFDVLEDINNEKEKISILWKEWNDKKLCVHKFEYDSEDDKHDNDDHDHDHDDDALLTQIPDFIYNFQKDLNCSYDTYQNQNIYTYRIRRWIDKTLEDKAVAKLHKKYKNLPKYSWIADQSTMLNEGYVLSDDLILIQNSSCLSTKPKWFKWINEPNFIRDSGFFDKNSGIYGILKNDDNTTNILKNGVCCIGDFKFGAEPTDDELDLYGVIRLDVLVPSLLRLPLYRNPNILNVGKSMLNNDDIISNNAIIQNGALYFDNNYNDKRSSKGVSLKINLKPLIENYDYNKKGELNDEWTLCLGFNHPTPNKKSNRSTLLFKENCMEICIENKYDENDKFIKEELIVKIYSKNNGSRFVEIFRKKITLNTPNILMIQKKINGKLFGSLNGRQCLLLVDSMNRTNLFNLKKTQNLFLASTNNDDNLFNGHIFQFCIYPKVFDEFELRAFQQQTQSHCRKLIIFD